MGTPIDEQNAPTEDAGRPAVGLKEVRAVDERLLDSLGMGVLITNEQGLITRIYAQALTLTGYSGEDLVEKVSLLDLIVPGQRDEVRQRRAAPARQMPDTYLARMQHRDGHSLDVLVTENQHADGRSTLVCVTNVTHCRQAQAELEVKSKLLAAQLDATLDAVLTIDNEDRAILYNCRFVDMWGIPARLLVSSEAQPIRQHLMDQLVDPEILAERHRFILVHPTATVHCELNTEDGRCIDCYSVPLLDAGSQPGGRIWYFLDVTDACRTEKEVQLLRAAVAVSRDGIIVTDVSGVVVYVNEAMSKIFGYSGGDLLQTQVIDCGLPEEQKSLEDLLEVGDASREVRFRHRDGEMRWAAISTSQVRDDEGLPTAVLAIVRDVTDEKRLQERLYRADKMVTVGQLLSGVAHELNNPLTSVMGFVELILALNDLPGTVKADLLAIQQETERASHIVRNLLSVVRIHEPRREAVDLNALIRNTVGLRAYDLRLDNILTALDLGDRLPSPLVDPYQIQQVLLNLISNAHQAITLSDRKGGTLTMRSQFVAPNTVRIQVTDDGPGIAPDVMPRLFDTFFTTKPEGMGTGLGLSICQSIIKDHAGHLRVESEPGRGATFIIELPVTRQIVKQAPGPVLEEARPLSRQSRRILVVDDEELVSSMLSRLFRRLDHEVVTALSATKALEYLAVQSFDAVLLDIRMPDMDGKELFRTIQQRWPQMAQRVAFLTGDVLSPPTQAFLETAGRPALDKPFYPHQIQKLLEELI